MLEHIISGLIYLLIIAAVIYLVLWVVREVAGIALPEKVVKIIWVIFVLIAVLIVLRVMLPGGVLPRLW